MKKAKHLFLALLVAFWAGLVASPGNTLATHLPPAGRACTSFCLDNSGYAVFGTNFDNEISAGLLFVKPRGMAKSGWEPGTTGKIARWTSRYGSVTFDLAGYQLAWAGMNEAGLAISTMWLPGTEPHYPDERPPLASPLWLQYQLDTCATVEEIIANDARIRINEAQDHYLACDRTGTCAVLEFLEGKLVAHMAGDVPVKALTNAGYPNAVRAWQADRLSGNALQRFGIAADRVEAFEATTASQAVAYAFETLALASGQATGGTITQWSIVFDAENLRAHFNTSTNPEIRTVDLAEFDLSCGAPIQMLDVHTPLSGDISHQLQEYSFKANLQHLRSFLDRWETDLSAFEVEALARGIDGFRCKSPAAAAYQEESKPLLPPVVAWGALAVFHRLWPFWVTLALASVAVIVWRLARDGVASREKRVRWVLVTALTGPFGLTAYIASHSKRHGTTPATG